MEDVALARIEASLAIIGAANVVVGSYELISANE